MRSFLLRADEVDIILSKLVRYAHSSYMGNELNEVVTSINIAMREATEGPNKERKGDDESHNYKEMAQAELEIYKLFEIAEALRDDMGPQGTMRMTKLFSIAIANGYGRGG
jgi:hypothetical protein